MDSRRLAILFREVNDRIYDLADSTEPDLPMRFLCECGLDCDRRVELVPAAFAALRKDRRVVRAPECRPSRRALLGRRRGRDRLHGIAAAA